MNSDVRVSILFVTDPPLFSSLVHNPDADFIEVNQQVGWILVHAIGAYLLQFFFAIAARK